MLEIKLTPFRRRRSNPVGDVPSGSGWICVVPLQIRALWGQLFDPVDFQRHSVFAKTGVFALPEVAAQGWVVSESK